MVLNRGTEHVRGDRQENIRYFPDHIITAVGPPEKFTFPFFYEPHPLCLFAAAALQNYLQSRDDLDHNFGLTPATQDGAIGKMFGVLVVADAVGRLGYLWAFSGKLAGRNDHVDFVPPVFDMLAEDGFFMREASAIDTLSQELSLLEADPEYLRLKAVAGQQATQEQREIVSLKAELSANRDDRKRSRLAGQELAREAEAALEAELVRDSLRDKRRLRDLTEYWRLRTASAEGALVETEGRIEALRRERRERSAALQEQLFREYVFLNSAGLEKSLGAIFLETPFGRPPSAAGECATPKLLQAAFLYGYKPLAMAEFWWGASPKSEIRKHGRFYPACAGKCKPILSHMLEGIETDDNPFLQRQETDRSLSIVYEDAYLIVVNKPSGLRSVPGVDIEDSVYSRLKLMVPGTEPLIVHRLDMDTSGLLVVARTPEVHRGLQRQFLKRTVSKRYSALLSGKVAGKEGTITLPLRADPYNRPRQLVCFETGKTSITHWKAIEEVNGQTRVHFWPQTGRTHQLRMHAAHELGLNAPIIGDDLYGVSAERLFLHAAELAFVHPVTKARMSFVAEEEF